ncbi:hypothetical protein EGW08_019904 [Elysia chlorotica]|uniref:Uncharacterized protein n=1 Tax=Elysia chlorotica TaxID=188477 RepID=A0A433SSU7_ELYCH|nr:hypothetical protein EGW08_019904 [Elysia chlorotica]
MEKTWTWNNGPYPTDRLVPFRTRPLSRQAEMGESKMDVQSAEPQLRLRRTAGLQYPLCLVLIKPSESGGRAIKLPNYHSLVVSVSSHVPLCACPVSLGCSAWCMRAARNLPLCAGIAISHYFENASSVLIDLLDRGHITKYQDNRYVDRTTGKRKAIRDGVGKGGMSFSYGCPNWTVRPMSTMSSCESRRSVMERAVGLEIECPRDVPSAFSCSEGPRWPWVGTLASDAKGILEKSVFKVLNREPENNGGRPTQIKFCLPIAKHRNRRATRKLSLLRQDSGSSIVRLLLSEWREGVEGLLRVIGSDNHKEFRSGLIEGRVESG